MNNIMSNNDIHIEDMIYEIKGRQVMLDSDLAKLYKVATKRINEAVKNNPEKFPERFSWKLTDSESRVFWPKISTKKLKLVVENIKIQGSLLNKGLLCLLLF